MSSTSDTELPTATIEKPALDPISIASPEDALANSSENLSRIKSAKNIGTTTPEVEGEENEPIATVEEIPSTPVSARDPIFQALPLTMESKEDSLPLPPTPEETSPSNVSEEAEVRSLPEPSVVEAEQLDSLGEPKIVKEEGLGGIEGETPELEETEARDGEQTEEIPGVESSISHGEQLVAPPTHASITQEPETEVEVPVVEEKEEGSPVSSDIPVTLEATDLDSEVLETAGPITDENSDSELVGKAQEVPAELAHTDPEPLTEEHLEAEDSNAEIIQPQDNGNIETQYALDPQPDIEAPTLEETTEGDSEDKTQVTGQSEIVISKPEDIPLDDGSSGIPSGAFSGKEGNEFSEVEARIDENESAVEAEVPLLETVSPPEEVELPQTSTDETAEASGEPELVEAEELVPEGVPEPVASLEAIEIAGTTEDVESITPKNTQTTDDVGGGTDYPPVESSLDGENEPALEAEVPPPEAFSSSEEVEVAQPSADETAQVSRELELVEAEEELAPEGASEPVTSPDAPAIAATAEDVESGAPGDTQTTDGVGGGTEHPPIEDSLDGGSELALEAEVPLEAFSPSEEVGLTQTPVDETAQASRELELVDAEGELAPEGVPESVTSPEALEIAATAEDVESGAPGDTQTTDSIGREKEYSTIEDPLDGAREVAGELEPMAVEPLETEQSTGAEQYTESLASLAQPLETQLPDPRLSPGDTSVSEQVAPVSEEDEPREDLKDEVPLEELSESTKESESAALEPSPVTLELEPAAPGLSEEAPKVEPSLEELAETLGETETEGTESDMKQVELSIEAPAVTESPLERATDQELKESVVTEPGAQPEVEESKEAEERPLPDEIPEGGRSISDEDPIVTQHMVELDEPIVEPEVKAEGSEESVVEQENTTFKQAQEEIATIHENGTILESSSASANAGAKEPQEEEARAPLAGSQAEDPVDKASLNGSGLPGESIGVPLVVVEKTADNQPSHGEDLGPDATVGQKEAFELRRADAEPDKVIIVEDPLVSTVTTGESTCEPASTTPNAETEVHTESAEEPGPEGIEEDEPVIISHDDAPLEDVEKAEAAVLPVSEILGGSEGVDTRITENIDAPAYTQQEEEEAPQAPQDPLPASELFSNSINPTGNQDESDLGVLKPNEEGNVQGISVLPLLASETPGDPVALVSSEEISGEANASVHEDVTSDLETVEKAGAPDLGDTEREEETMPNETEIPVASEESKETALVSELSSKAEAFVAPREQDNFAAGEEISVLELTEDLPKGAGDPVLTSETFSNSTDDVSREDVPSSSTEPIVESGEEGSHESADASDLFIPNEDGGDAQGTSVSLLPASETLGNPIELASGEEVPREVEASVDTVAELDVEQPGASKSMEEPEALPTGLFPPSESSANPIDTQPGESSPEIGENSAELGLVLESESEGKQGASSFSPEKTQSPEQELPVDPLPSSSTLINPTVDTRESSVSQLPSLGAPSGEMSKDIDTSLIRPSVELNEESYEKVDRSSLGAEVVVDQPAKAEESADHSNLSAEVLVDQPAKAEESIDIPGGEALAVGLATAASIGLVGALVKESFEGKADQVDIHGTSFVTEPKSASDPEMGGTEVPAVEKTVDLPTPIEQEALPIEIAPEVSLQKGLSEHPATSTPEIEPGLIADKSTGEILNLPSPDADSNVIDITRDKAYDKKPFQASAVDVPDEASVTVTEVPQSKDKSVVEGDKQIKPELPSQNSPSPAYGVAVLEADVPEITKAADASKAPAIVISSPPGSPAKGDVTEPTPEVMFDEGSANRARESENTPEGVRKRKIPGGEASRPTSSGTDTVSTRHHRNVMNTFWHVLFFGWLGGFGRFFGGMFSKSKKTRK